MEKSLSLYETLGLSVKKEKIGIHIKRNILSLSALKNQFSKLTILKKNDLCYLSRKIILNLQLH